MAYEENWVGHTIKAGENLDDVTFGTGDIHKVLTMAGQHAADGRTAVGILKDGVSANNSGFHITVGLQGVMKYTAGAAISSSDLLTVAASGYVTAAASGSYVIGRNLENSVTSGSLGSGIFWFGFGGVEHQTSAWIHTHAWYGFGAQANLTVAAAIGKAIDSSAGDFAASPAADGILVFGTTSGGTSYMAPSGIVDAIAGGVLASGDDVTAAASGYMLKSTSGQFSLGRALAASAAGNSGSTFKMVVSGRYIAHAIEVNSQ